MEKYKIFGLNVLSEIKLNCYKTDFDFADVTIKKAVDKQSLDNWLSDKSEKLNHFALNENLKYYIYAGSEIIISKSNEIEAELVSLYLLGTAFAILFMQRNIFMMHGSTISINNKSIMIIGSTGAGKSTLAAGFVQKGGKVITDDVSRIAYEETFPYVYPSYPSQKLWKNAMDHLSINLDNSTKIIDKYDKYSIEDNHIFTDLIFPLIGIVEVNPTKSKSVTIEKTNMSNSFTVLIKNTYRNELIQQLDKSKEHFNFVSDVCKSVPVYQLCRPENEFTISEQVESIIEQLGVFANT